MNNREKPKKYSVIDLERNKEEEEMSQSVCVCWNVHSYTWYELKKTKGFEKCFKLMLYFYILSQRIRETILIV